MGRGGKAQPPWQSLIFVIFIFFFSSFSLPLLGRRAVPAALPGPRMLGGASLGVPAVPAASGVARGSWLSLSAPLRRFLAGSGARQRVPELSEFLGREGCEERCSIAWVRGGSSSPRGCAPVN